MEPKKRRRRARPLPGRLRGLRIATRQLRKECWTLVLHLRSRIFGRRFLRGEQLKLNVGCGANRKDGWVNIDLRWRGSDLSLDLRERWPFRSGSCALVYSEHFLEHFDYPQFAEFMLGEAHRVLEPGGRVSVGVPDAARAVDYYREGSTAEFGDALARYPIWCNTRMEHINYSFRMGLPPSVRVRLRNARGVAAPDGLLRRETPHVRPGARQRTPQSRDAVRRGRQAERLTRGGHAPAPSSAWYLSSSARASFTTSWRSETCRRPASPSVFQRSGSESSVPRDCASASASPSGAKRRRGGGRDDVRDVGVPRGDDRGAARLRFEQDRGGAAFAVAVARRDARLQQEVRPLELLEHEVVTPHPEPRDGFAHAERVRELRELAQHRTVADDPELHRGSARRGRERAKADVKALLLDQSTHEQHANRSNAVPASDAKRIVVDGDRDALNRDPVFRASEQGEPANELGPFDEKQAPDLEEALVRSRAFRGRIGAVEAGDQRQARRVRELRRAFAAAAEVRVEQPDVVLSNRAARATELNAVHALAPQIRPPARRADALRERDDLPVRKRELIQVRDASRQHDRAHRSQVSQILPDEGLRLQ